MFTINKVNKVANQTQGASSNERARVPETNIKTYLYIYISPQIIEILCAKSANSANLGPTTFPNSWPPPAVKRPVEKRSTNDTEVSTKASVRCSTVRHGPDLGNWA